MLTTLFIIFCVFQFYQLPRGGHFQLGTRKGGPIVIFPDSPDTDSPR